MVQTLKGREQLFPSEQPQCGYLFSEIREQKVLFKTSTSSSLERTDCFLKNKLSIQLNSTTGKYCSYPFGEMCSMLLLQSPANNSNKSHRTEKFSSQLKQNNEISTSVILQNIRRCRILALHQTLFHYRSGRSVDTSIAVKIHICIPFLILYFPELQVDTYEY